MAMSTGGKIDKALKIPLYYQLKEILLEEIRQLEPDEMMEPESVLIAKYDVSRTTVRQAIAELIRENYLYTIRGKGTFVAKRQDGLRYMNQIESYDEQVRQSGLVPSTRILEQQIILANKNIAEQMRVQENSGVLHLKRLRYADKIPLCIAESYLPLPECAPLVQKDMENHSLYTALEEDCGKKVVHVHRRIKAGLANAEDSKILMVDQGTPLLFFTNIATTEDGQVVEYCESRFRVDMIAFTVELNI